MRLNIENSWRGGAIVAVVVFICTMIMFRLMVFIVSHW